MRSFSASAKAEICREFPQSGCCALAECFGILLFCNSFRNDSIKIITESGEFAALLPKLFKKAFGFGFDSPAGEGKGGKQIFQIQSAEKMTTIMNAFGFDTRQTFSLHINLPVVENDCCKTAFLRGAFLSGGSVTDPGKGYHLELATTHAKVGRETHALMLDLNLSPKETERGGSVVLYFKQSDYIEDFLTTIGAPVCAMEIMEAKVEKELINGVNRRVNCETANLTKVVDAAQEQIAAIRRLAQAGGLEALPEKLRQSAQLRLENPEATLQELADMQTPPVSKSAINHRMRKLVQLAAQQTT